MSDSSVFSKLLSAAVFIALCAYLLAYMSTLSDGGSLTLACDCVRESIRFEGIALRSEQTLCSERELKIVRTSGERIAAGGIVAVSTEEKILSPVSSLFFADTDGWEYLVPPESMTAETFDRLFHAPPKKEKNRIGRLVTARSWYIAACTDAADLPAGRRTLYIDGMEDGLSSQLISSAPVGEGKCVVLLKLTCEKSGVLSLRRCKGEIVLREYSGFSVPQSAVGTAEDGRNYVNIITAAGKEKTEAVIVYNKKGKLLLAPSDKLKEGMRIAGRAA